MKKIIVMAGCLLLLATTGIAQNLQLHYDYGKADDGETNKDRDYFTTTLEMFKPDSLGYTFFFVDMDYNGDNGMSFAYWEIVRGFNIPGIKSLKLELSYTGGIAYVNDAWLAGPAVPIAFKNGFATISAYYRGEKHQDRANAQITGVWTVNFFKGKVKFTGFMDVWTRDDFVEGKGKMISFLTEPQVWYNLNDHFALGGEVEVSKNFFTFDNDVEVMPTAAIKWTF
jgi:hypothetical protein